MPLLAHENIPGMSNTEIGGLISVLNNLLLRPTWLLKLLCAIVQLSPSPRWILRSLNFTTPTLYEPRIGMVAGRDGEVC